MLSKQIAEFVCSTEYDNIPHLTIENAKRTMLDCIGVSLASVQDRNVLMVKDFVCDMGGKQESTIFGDGRKTPAVNAALVNGVAAHSLDYDDVSYVMRGHPSAISCPPVFALGERQGSSGKEILAAYVLGGEVACRLGAAMTDRHYELGWHNTGTVGTFGATVAAAKLLRLDQERMTTALGIAASMASGLKKNFGTSCKPYHAGQACSNGIRAALLAKSGFTSSPDIFEGKTGFVQLFSGAFRSEEITEMMGSPYVIDDPGYSLKVYPSCGFTHSAMDCILGLKEQYGFSPEDVSHVECGCSQGAIDTARYGIAETGLEGKFSMPFCIAVSILEKQIGLAEFSDEKCRDPRVVGLEKKIRTYCDPEINGRGYADDGARVKIFLSSGKKLETAINKPRGDPAQTLSDDVIMTKFNSCVSTSINREQGKKLADSIMSLEKIQDVNSTTPFLFRN